MLKRLFLCLVVASVCSMSQSAVAQQDLFLSFGQGADATNTAITVAENAGAGTAFLFARNGFNFDAIDVNVTSSNSATGTLTGSTIFNSSIGGFINRYNEPVVDGLLPDGSARFFGASFANTGVDTMFSGADEDFDAVADAFLVGELQYDALAPGTTNFEINLGGNSILLNDGTIYANPNFGAATLTVGVPEPSSVAVLALGLAGMVTRRRRR